MTTLATLKARIADDLRRSDLTSQIASAIRDAIKRWEGERFWFNEKRFRLTTMAGTEEYAIPATLTNTDDTALATGEDLLAIDDVTILYGSDSYRLYERSDQWLNDYQAPASTYQGTPDHYGVYANKIRIGPIPDAAYTITVSGLARLSTLSAGTDTNAWTDEAESLTRHQALAEIFRTVLRDGDGFQFALGGVQDAVEHLKRKGTGKIMTGRVRAWGYA
jgi:hypothetical protein